MKVLNRKVRFDYEIIEEFEFGLVLLSSEVKAIREGSVNIQEAYLEYAMPHFMIYNMFIGDYKNLKNENKRDRVVLLKKKEGNKLISKIQKKGYTLIPIELYFNKRGFVKIKCGLGIGKKLYDKRVAIRAKEMRREKEKLFKL